MCKRIGVCVGKTAACTRNVKADIKQKAELKYPHQGGNFNSRQSDKKGNLFSIFGRKIAGSFAG